MTDPDNARWPRTTVGEVRSAVSTGAILFTDMVDSSALRSRIGDDRADRLRKEHDDLLTAAVTQNRGEVLRWTGDGVKAGFETSSDAVAAAVAIQRAVAAYGSSPQALAPFQVRIGVSAGELTVDEGGDHRGIAVIEAARLEALARPGETLVTEVVRLLGGRRSNVTFEEVGERTLKGLDGPVLVFRVVDLASRGIAAVPRFLAGEHRLPLVGRRQAVAEFQSRWDDARVGGTGVVLVSGQAGIGKTRFVSTCASLAHRSGALVIGGVCSSDVGVPYEPFAMALSAMRPLDSALDQEADTSGGPLARLFPGAAATAEGNLPVAARIELFDAFASVIRRLCTTSPVLLVLDDLHWATEPTVQLLRHLIRSVDGERLLLMGTFRDGDLDLRHPLRELLAELRGAPAITSIELSTLTESDVAEMVTSVDPSAPISRIAEAAQLVHGESSGNPFFASELVQHLVSTGQLEQGSTSAVAGRLAVPGSVHNVVLQRLAKQAPGTHDILVLAAVVGPSFDLDLLAAVSDRSADDLLDLLEPVARSGLIDEIGVDRFAFAHAIVRNALLEELSASRRARTHRKIAEALEAGGADQFDELALHWQLAGDDTRATRYLIQSARRDMNALAHGLARDRFQQVVDVLSRDPRADLNSLAEARLGLAEAMRALGDGAFTQAVMHAARLARTARNDELVVQAAVISTWLGRMYFTAEAPDQELIELCEDALELASPTDPVRVRVLVTLASHLTFEADSSTRRQLIAEAAELAARHDDPLLTATVLQAEFSCLWDPTTLDRRERIARDLTRLGRATGDLQVEFVAGFFTAYCMVERGELLAARQRLVELGPTAEASGDDYCRFLVDRLILTIDLARSVPGVDEQVDAFVRREQPTQVDAEATWMLHTGILARQAGTLGQIAGAMSAMTAGPQPVMWSAAQGLALLHAGDTAGATAVLDRVTELPQNYFWLAAVEARAETAAVLGRVDHCRTMFDQLSPYRGRLGVTGAGSGCIALVSRVLGMLALALDQVDEAIELLTDAVAQADRVEFAFEGVIGRRLLAEALGRAQRPTEAEQAVCAALATAETRGFALESSLLRAMLR